MTKTDKSDLDSLKYWAEQKFNHFDNLRKKHRKNEWLKNVTQIYSIVLEEINKRLHKSNQNDKNN